MILPSAYFKQGQNKSWDFNKRDNSNGNIRITNKPNSGEGKLRHLGDKTENKTKFKY